MIDIYEFEERILIEASFSPWPLRNLTNEISLSNKNLSKFEVYQTTCKIIGSLYVQGLIIPVKSFYSEVEEGTFKHEKTVELTNIEMEILLKQPEQWQQLNIESFIDPIELKITEIGRAKYEEEIAF